MGVGDWSGARGGCLGGRSKMLPCTMAASMKAVVMQADISLPPLSLGLEFCHTG
jgi:hypothetical protein